MQHSQPRFREHSYSVQCSFCKWPSVRHVGCPASKTPRKLLCAKSSSPIALPGYGDDMLTSTTQRTRFHSRSVQRRAFRDASGYSSRRLSDVVQVSFGATSANARSPSPATRQKFPNAMTCIPPHVSTLHRSSSPARWPAAHVSNMMACYQYLPYIYIYYMWAVPCGR